MSVTIKDIAKLAGVSHTTVSRVLNNYSHVKPDKREKILKIMKDLNFSPQTSARSLSTGKTYTVGLLVLYDLQQFPELFLSSILVGLTTELNKGGYNLSLFFDQVHGRKNQVSLEALTSKNYDGIFILSVETDAELAYKVAKINLPTVLINQYVEDLNLNYVVADDEGGAYEATKHLLSLGHRNIALLLGDPKYKTNVDRKSGYRRALSEYGIYPDLSLEKVGNFNTNRGYLAMCELLDERPDISAVFATNDLMALGAYKAIKERKLRIPDDISVVGFDDTEYAEVSDPPLTTVRKTRALMGSEAAKIMLELLNSPDIDSARQVVLPTKLIIRGSSAK